MTDLRKDFSPTDPTHVNLEADLEVRYWCRHFSVTPDKLRDAVERTDGSIRDVSLQLQQTH